MDKVQSKSAKIGILVCALLGAHTTAAAQGYSVALARVDAASARGLASGSTTAVFDVRFTTVRRFGLAQLPGSFRSRLVAENKGFLFHPGLIAIIYRKTQRGIEIGTWHRQYGAGVCFPSDVVEEFKLQRILRKPSSDDQYCYKE